MRKPTDALEFTSGMALQQLYQPVLLRRLELSIPLLEVSVQLAATSETLKKAMFRPGLQKPLQCSLGFDLEASEGKAS